jgi:hypothetical protein
VDEILYYVIIFAIYIGAQFLSARKKRQEQRELERDLPEGAVVTETRRGDAEPTFEDALAEIQRVLRGEAPEPPPSEVPPRARPEGRGDGAIPERLERPEPASAPDPFGASAPLPAPPAPIRRPAPPEDRGAAFRQEDIFEQVGTQPFRSLEEMKIGASIPELPEPSKQRARRPSRSNIAAMLRTPSAARDAFVLSEVLGKPGGLHKPPEQGQER